MAKNSYKFRYKLSREEGFQILNQTEKIEREGGVPIFSVRGFDFVSVSMPEIDGDTVFLRGSSHGYDFDTVSRERIAQMSEERFNALKAALDDFTIYVQKNY